MDTNKRPAGPVPEPPVENGDWRSQLQSDSRQRIVTKIMDTLKRHLPFSGQEGLQELKKIAMRFEEKIYTAASSQTDYLRKISLKMLTMETKSQNTLPNPLAPNSAGNSNNPPDSGVTHTQVQSQGQSLPVPLLANQSQARPQLLQENIQNNFVTNAVQSSTGLPSASLPASGLTQTSMSNIVGQNPNLQSLSGISQNSAGNSIGPGIPTNMFANSQRHMQVRQQGVPQQQQQQNNPHYLYQQQLHQLNRQKLQQGNLQHPLVQSHVQQQQQPNLLQSPQLQASQQSGMQKSNVMQPSLMQSSSLPGLPQNQPTSVQQSTQPLLQQHPQSVMRQQQQTQQASGINQQQTPMMQQQQLMGSKRIPHTCSKIS